MVLAIDIVDLHHRSEHLLPLGRAEIDAFVWLLFKDFTVHQPPHLHVLPHHQRFVFPVACLDPLHNQHYLFAVDVSVSLHLVVFQRLLPVLIPMVNL
jgi:hypothetical protein